MRNEGGGVMPNWEDLRETLLFMVMIGLGLGLLILTMSL